MMVILNSTGRCDSNDTKFAYDFDLWFLVSENGSKPRSEECGLTTLYSHGGVFS